MAPPTPKRLLSDALEDLTQSNLERFRHALLDRRGGTRRVRRNQLEGKSILEVSDVMIGLFTEKQALTVAEEVLRSIGCCQDADDLAEAVRLSSLSGEDSANAESSDEEHFVDKHRNELIQRVTNVSAILDHLLKEKVITNEIYDEIRSKPINVEKMRAIYSGPLRGGKGCKDIFYKILQNQEKFLVADLEGN